MHSLNEISQWHPRSLQKWLQEIDEQDLMIVMPHISKSVSHIILENLSSRVRKRLIESMDEYSHVPKRRADKAIDRILDIANELIEIGILDRPGDEDGESDFPRTTVLPNSLPSSDTRSLIQTLALLGKYAEERGILALEESLGKINDKFLKEAIQLIIDGTESELVEEILRNRVQAITYHRELLQNLVIEGILGIQAGNSSWTLKMRLKSHLPPEIGGEDILGPGTSSI